MVVSPLPTYPASAELPAQAFEDLRTLGILRLRGAVEPDHAARCRDALWRALAAAGGVVRDDPSTWGRIESTLVKPLAGEPDFAFAPLPRLSAVLSRLLPGPTIRPKTGGLFFLSPPTPPSEAWSLPRGRWHWDGRPEPSSVAFMTFTILAPLARRHGGTLFVAGSHHLVRRFYAELPDADADAPTRKLKPRFLRRHPWMAALQAAQPGSDELVAAMMDRSFIAEGQELRIVDIHGEPGDVILVAWAMVHSAPAHIGPAPRMVHMCSTSARWGEAASAAGSADSRPGSAG
jgi:hypothetical protein